MGIVTTREIQVVCGSKGGQSEVAMMILQIFTENPDEPGSFSPCSIPTKALQTCCSSVLLLERILNEMSRMSKMQLVNEGLGKENL